MRIRRGLRSFALLAVLLSALAGSSQGATTNPPLDPSRPSTVVVSVRDDGFDWADAGVGAAAMFATTLLALGLVLALRPDRGSTWQPMKRL